MNKEKEIERMAKAMNVNRLQDIYSLSRVIANSVHFGEDNDENMLAQDILDAGYVKVKEFVSVVNDELKNMITESGSWYGEGYDDCIFDVRELLDSLITKLYGEDK